MNTATPSPPGFCQRAIASVLFAVLSALILVWMIGNGSRFQIIWLLGTFLLIFASVFFAAVWRHGFRWLFSRRALRFRAGVVVTVITLVVLFYTEESWRGKRAWAGLQREAAARGESLEWSSLATPAVPDDQNFAKAPGVAELFSLRKQRHSTWPYQYGAENTTSWALQQFTDLVWWQRFFRDYAHSVTGERTANTLTFPVTPEPQTPAADVLFALDKYAPILAALRAASQRPALRLPLDYSCRQRPASSAGHRFDIAIAPLGGPSALPARLGRTTAGTERSRLSGRPAGFAPCATGAG